MIVALVRLARSPMLGAWCFIMHVVYIHVICVLSAMWVVLIHQRLFNYGIHLLQAQTKDSTGDQSW
jgi:hypothetical protein